MKSSSASSTLRFAWAPAQTPHCLMFALMFALLHCSSVQAQSTPVPIQTPQQVLAQPLRSIAEVVRGEQTVRTRNGIGFRKVHVRAQDEIWLVSARREDQCDLSLQRLSNGQWISASMSELIESHATDQQKPSLVYVHGNRTDEIYARSRGLQFYENVFNDDICSGSIRFVIFAWRRNVRRFGQCPIFVLSSTERLS